MNDKINEHKHGTYARREEKTRRKREGEGEERRKGPQEETTDE